MATATAEPVAKVRYLAVTPDVAARLADPKSAVGKILERVNNIAQNVDDAADDLGYNCITRRQVINALGTIAQELRTITEE